MLENDNNVNSENTEVGPQSSIPDDVPSKDTSSQSAPSNNIFIGKKPVMSYAMSGLIQLGQSDEIIIKGRGMVISRVVDVALIITERLGKGKFSTKSIAIDTVVLGEDTEKRNVSTIEIVVGQK